MSTSRGRKATYIGPTTIENIKADYQNGMPKIELVKKYRTNYSRINEYIKDCPKNKAGRKKKPIDNPNLYEDVKNDFISGKYKIQDIVDKHKISVRTFYLIING